MANATGQDLVDGARKRAGYQNTAFVLDDEVLTWINDARIELYDLLNQQDESVYSTPYEFQLPDPLLAAAYTAAGLGTPPANFAMLPEDLDRIQGLDYLPGGLTTTPVTPTVAGGPFLSINSFGTTPVTNSTSASLTQADEHYVDFDQFGATLDVRVSFVVKSAAAASPGGFFVYATATEGDVTGTGTLLGQVTFAAGGTGGVFVGVASHGTIANPGGLKYLSICDKAGNNSGTPVSMQWAGFVLEIGNAP